MIVHAKRTQVAPMRAPASIDHACNRCAAGENDHVLLSLLDYHTKSPSPCQGGNRISFSLFFPGAGVCIFLLRRPLQGAGIRAAGRPGCAGANGLRPFRRLRRRACGPHHPQTCPLHTPPTDKITRQGRPHRVMLSRYSVISPAPARSCGSPPRSSRRAPGRCASRFRGNCW